MIIKFRTASTMDFKNVLYTIVFNTSGNGQMPYANGYNTGYANYSFIMVVDGTNGTLQTYVKQVLVVSGQVTTRTLTNYAPNQLVPNYNSNGQGTEFSLDFDRNILYGLQTPGPTTVPGQQTWYVNFITTDTKGIPLDTLGPNGVQDTSFQNPLYIALLPGIDVTQTVPVGAPVSGVPAANIAGGEFLNTP